MTKNRANKYGQKNIPKWPKFFIRNLKFGILMLNEPKNLCLQIDLNKPQEKGKIIPRIKPMPKGTNHKHIQLRNAPSPKRRSLIDTFPQPFLDGCVPMGYFRADVLVGLDGEGGAGVY
jgi:hypothetical protein